LGELSEDIAVVVSWVVGWERETNAWTWRKGSCSLVEDIILGGCALDGVLSIYRRLYPLLMICAAKG
jgi:hypothetical protein